MSTVSRRSTHALPSARGRRCSPARRLRGLRGVRPRPHSRRQGPRLDVDDQPLVPPDPPRHDRRRRHPGAGLDRVPADVVGSRLARFGRAGEFRGLAGRQGAARPHPPRPQDGSALGLPAGLRGLRPARPGDVLAGAGELAAGAEGRAAPGAGRVVDRGGVPMRAPTLVVLVALALPVAAGEAIFDPSFKLEVVAKGGAGGEGPAWHPKLGVLSSGNGHVYRLDLAGKSTVWRKDAGTNGLLFDGKGRLVACDSKRRRVTRTEPDGTLTVLTDRHEGKRYNTPNDLTIDSRGRVYFSDPRYGSRDDMQIRDADGRTIEGVYRIDPDGKVTRILGREVDRPNGVLVSGDERYLYVADNNNDTVAGARKLWRFDLKKDGSVDPESRKLLYDWGKGRGPDGLKQDAKGRLYVAAGLNKPNPPAEPADDVKGGIYVLSPEGKRLAFLAVPTDEVTNCAFGDEDCKTLYVTGGGVLYKVRTTTPGRLVWPR